MFLGEDLGKLDEIFMGWQDQRLCLAGREKHLSLLLVNETTVQNQSVSREGRWKDFTNLTSVFETWTTSNLLLLEMFWSNILHQTVPIDLNSQLSKHVK